MELHILFILEVYIFLIVLCNVLTMDNIIFVHNLARHIAEQFKSTVIT
jgi:predicted tellurium resistance membrane protein TerC